MGAEQTAETAPTAKGGSRRFSRLGLRETLIRLFPAFQLSSEDASVQSGPDISRRGFMGVTAAVFMKPNLLLEIGAGNSANPEVKSLVLPIEEQVLITNLRRYVAPERIGPLGEDLNQQTIDQLRGRRRVTEDPFGRDYAWDKIPLDGLNLLTAGFRRGRSGDLEYFESISVADLTQSQFEKELVAVYASRFSKVGLPGYRLETALGEYFRVPANAFKIEEVRRHGDNMNGIHIAGESLSNYLYTVDFYADGLIGINIQNQNTQQTGPLA